jgi:hypothetical protein
MSFVVRGGGNETGMTEPEMMAEHGMTNYSCNLNK